MLEEIRESLQQGQILIMYKATYCLVNQNTLHLRPINGGEEMVALAFRLYTPNWNHKAH